MPVREVQSGEMLTASLWNEMVRWVHSKANQADIAQQLTGFTEDSESNLGEIVQQLSKATEQLKILSERNLQLKNKVLQLEAEWTKNPAEGFETPEMLFIKGGTFKMSHPTDAGAKPERDVTLNDFWMSKYLITQKQWKKLMGKNPSTFSGDTLPVDSVNWHDANQYIFALNQRTGQKYRLPTEAEWEYAAKGNESYEYPGNSDVNAVAWHGGNSGSTTQRVGLKQPNAFGLYDIAGNVWHLCYDRHINYDNKAVSNPRGATQGWNCVLRGGCWQNAATNSRVSFRGYHNRTLVSNHVGFRIVMEPPTDKQP